MIHSKWCNNRDDGMLQDIGSIVFAITTVRDADGRINELYGTAQIPETYIIDKNGILRRKFVNAQNWTSPEITSYLAHLQ